MGRVTWLQLRSGAARSVALLLGMLLATTAFTVLTAASRTAQLRTIGTVSSHFVPAYDILVRPTGARTARETRTGTVQPNFLSGIYGGITLGQYHQIAQIRGVQVAAPIAMVGYSMILSATTVFLPAADYAAPGRQLYRESTTWVSASGTNRITQPPSYIYVTPDRIKVDENTGDSTEVVASGSSVPVCVASFGPPGGAAPPFSIGAQSASYCWSKVDGLSGSYLGGSAAHGAYAYVVWEFPMLIAAIDPDAEAKLDGLNRAITSGSYLRESAREGQLRQNGAVQTTIPVLATSSSGIDEQAVTRIQWLAAPSAPPSLNAGMMARDASVPARTVSTTTVTAQQAYNQLLRKIGSRRGLDTIDNLWTAGPVSYRSGADGTLAPEQVRNPPSVWQLFSGAGGGVLAVPMDEEDTQYRSVHGHLATLSGGTVAPPLARLVGVFDPTRIRSFSQLSQVPLGPYQPVEAAPADASSRAALADGDLLPSLNLGGYVSQPVQLVTTLTALPALENGAAFSGNLHAKDPISVIRVRVADVTGPNAVSLERIRVVAQQIEQRTHLAVDIVAGSSPEPTTIELPAGKDGQLALTLSENWVKKGVALTILTAVDKNSVVLFTLILIVCVLFVANSATAAVRGRRRELGVLACLGWTRPRLFAEVLGELAAIGLAAGILGAVAALPLSSALGLHASPGRAALAVPIAVGVAVLAGAAPAWLAARAAPVASIRPAVLAVRRARHPGGITALAAVNVLRTPGRSLVAALSLAIGITAVTMLTAVTFAFRGVVVGTLLGNAVAVQVRGVDYVATIATIALGVLAVVDVVFLNIRERGAELATLRAFGWQESALSRLVVTEGAIIGVGGALAGAALGLAATAEFTGQLPPGLYLIAALALVVCAGITAVSALLPARALRHLPAAHLLAEE
jgi:putative ABC transport system permease protein